MAEGLIYITGFLIFGLVIGFPSPEAGPAAQLQAIVDHQTIYSITNLIIYVLFGILLVPLVLAIHQRLSGDAPHLMQIASVFGLIWVGLVISSGMIANIGLKTVTSFSPEDAEQAMLIWSSVAIVTDGLGGGNEIVGGMWVLLLSIAGFKGRLSKPLVFLGLLVGAFGVLTILPMEIFKMLFGLSQIVWFIWLGIYLMQKK